GVAREWLPYPPLRHVRGRGNMLEGWIIRSAVVSIPESELTVQFGCYKVTDWYKADVLKSLASRIANWQAEALVPRAGTVPTSKPMALDKPSLPARLAQQTEPFGPSERREKSDETSLIALQRRWAPRAKHS